MHRIQLISPSSNLSKFSEDYLVSHMTMKWIPNVFFLHIFVNAKVEPNERWQNPAIRTRTSCVYYARLFYFARTYFEDVLRLLWSTALYVFSPGCTRSSQNTSYSFFVISFSTLVRNKRWYYGSGYELQCAKTWSRSFMIHIIGSSGLFSVTRRSKPREKRIR